MADAKTPAVIHPPTPLDRMEQFHEAMRQRAITEAASRPDSLAAEIAARNMDQIFTAAEKENATEEDIWAAGSGGTIQGRDCVPAEGGTGLEVEIRGYRADTGTRTDDEGNVLGHGYYITADSVCLGGPAEVMRKLAIDVGDEFALQTGADDVIFRLRAFELRGWFPVRGVLAGVKTGKGNMILKLKPRPRRASN